MLGAVLEHLPVIAMVLDPDGTVRGPTESLTRALPPTRYGAGTLRHRARRAHELDRVRRELAEAARQSGTRQLEARLVRADGARCPLPSAW